MNKEFEAYYYPEQAVIFLVAAIVIFALPTVSLLGMAILMPAFLVWYVIAEILCIGGASVLLYVYQSMRSQKGIAVEIVDDRLFFHKKTPVCVPMSEIKAISIHDGYGSFDLTVKTAVKKYSIHCLVHEEQKKKREIIDLFKKRGIEVQTFYLAGD